MNIITLHDPEPIAAYLRRDAALYIYELGDLDPAYWSHTLWYGLEAEGQLFALALIYIGLDTPVLLMLANPLTPAYQVLLQQLQPLLPSSVYAHIHPQLAEHFTHYTLNTHGLYHKFRLASIEAAFAIDTQHVEPLDQSHLPEMYAFYAHSYPEHSFDARMLAAGFFYGIRENDQLVSVGGVHVFAPQQRVAALGNIATAPEARGRGYAAQITARLCQDLRPYADHIGLNVHAENTAAQACYQRVGFTYHADYLECSLEHNAATATARVPQPGA